MNREIKEGLEEHENSKKPNNQSEDEPITAEIPEGLIDVEKYIEMYGIEHGDELYDWYEKAITRRKREPLEYERFMYHFLEGGSYDKPFMYGDGIKRGYLMGFVKKGVFIGTHFAPKGLKGGVKIFEELGKNKELPTLLMVTDDVAKTISRIGGWVVEKWEVPSYFGDEEIKKIVVHNNIPQEKLLELVRDYTKAN